MCHSYMCPGRPAARSSSLAPRAKAAVVQRHSDGVQPAVRLADLQRIPLAADGALLFPAAHRVLNVRVQKPGVGLYLKMEFEEFY